jgi:hypothetical protein
MVREAAPFVTRNHTTVIALPAKAGIDRATQAMSAASMKTPVVILHDRRIGSPGQAGG